RVGPEHVGERQGQLLVAAFEVELLAHPGQDLGAGQPADLEGRLEVRVEQELADLFPGGASAGAGGQLLGGLPVAEVADDVAEVEDDRANARHYSWAPSWSRRRGDNHRVTEGTEDSTEETREGTAALVYFFLLSSAPLCCSASLCPL